MKTISIKRLAEILEITEEKIISDINKRYLTPYYPSEVGAYCEVEMDGYYRRYVETKGDLSGLTRLINRRGQIAFVMNKIQVFKYQDDEYSVYTSYEPNGRRRIFRNKSDKIARRQAYIYTFNNKQHCVRQSLSFAGTAQKVCHTKYELLYLLQLVPDIPSNKFLIKKLEEAYKRSEHSGRNFRRKKKNEQENEN